MAVKVAFGIACGCTILTGHAEEPMHGKWIPGHQAIEVAVQSSSTAMPSTGFANSVAALRRAFK